MIDQKTLGAIRFGFGPAGGRKADAAMLWASLERPDDVASRFPVVPVKEVLAVRKTEVQAIKDRREGRVPKIDEKKVGRQFGTFLTTGMDATFARVTATKTPIVERLNWFWSDHFSVSVSSKLLRGGMPGYWDEAIRPHVTGNFGDMLVAVTTHPAMLRFLDQNLSIGPNSKVGRNSNRGLNENLAREVLELHTLGVGGPYTQTDVRQLAELFTGLSYNFEGFNFRPEIAEPGAELVLGKTYGLGLADPRVVDEVLRDLAIHPVTARHLARKLAVHFVSDTPSDSLIAAMEAAYLANNADLMPVYEALLSHPDTWQPELQKVRQPREYLMAMLVALNVDVAEKLPDPDLKLSAMMGGSLYRMGQPFTGALGPDGWPEDARYWISAKGLAARINEALNLARRFGLDQGEPMDFLDQALGDAAGAPLKFAVSAAETRTEAIGLVLASSEMNRR